MAELEPPPSSLGYRRIHLTTGPRQPEARNLYLAAGYTPRFDQAADPETIGPLAFAKELLPGAGFADWEQPTWADIEAAHRRAGPADAAGAGRWRAPATAPRIPGWFGRTDSPLPPVRCDERRHLHSRLVNGAPR